MKNLKKLMSLFLALMLLMSSATSALATDTDIIAEEVVHPSQLLLTSVVQRSSDLTEFLYEVTITDPSGKDVTNESTLYDNTNYTFRIEFKEKSHELQFGEDANGKMTYQLPAGITYRGADKFYAKNGSQTVGEFEVSSDGKVTFTPWYYNATNKTYSPNPIDPNDKLFIEAFSDAKIWLELQGTLTSSGGKQNLVFSSTVKKEYTIDHVDKIPYADVTKDNENRKVYTDENGRHYFLTTIRATVKDGNPETLKLTDSLNPGSYLDPDLSQEFQIKRIRNSTETILTDVQPTWRKTGWPYGFDLELNSTNVPGGILENDEYVITYRTYFNEAGENYVGTGDPWAGANTIETDAGGDKKQAGIDYFIKGKPQIVKKSTSGADTTDPNVINWTIEIGDGETDIAGKTITDTWSEKVASTSQPRLDKIEMVDESRTIKLTVAKADGTTGIITIPADQAAQYFKATTDTNNKQNGFTFTVPNVPDGYEKIIKCEVNYQTRGTTSTGKGKFTIQNKAEYEDHRSGEAEGGGGVSSVDDFDVNKTFEGEDGNKLKFKVVLTIPGDIYNTGTHIYVSDWSYLNGWTWDKHKSYTVESVSVTASGGGIEKTFTEGTGDYTYQMVTADGGFKFFFNLPEGYSASGSDDYTNKNNSTWKWENDSDVTLTFEYVLLKPDDVTSGVVYNKAYVELDDKKKGDQVEVPFGKQEQIDKSAKLNGDGTITYTVLINGNFTAMIPTNATFIDTFDSDHLQYVNGSLKVEYLAKTGSNSFSTIGWPTYTSSTLGQNGQIQIQFDNFGQGGWAPGTSEHWYDADLKWGEYEKLTNWYQHPKTIGSVQDDGKEIHFGATFYPAVRLTYKLKIKNVKPGETKTLNNTARIDHYDEASASVTYTPTLLEKTSGALNGSTLSYTIKVNPSGMKLLPQGGNLRLIDTMSDNMTPLLQTLKVLKADGSELEKSKWMYFYDSGKRELEFSLPDETALTICYDVLIQGEANQHVKVTNTAKLDGFTESKTDEKSLTIGSASGGGGGSLYKLVLLKVAQESGSPLAGATFQIEWLPFQATAWQEFTEFETTENGMVEITRSKDDKEPIYHDTLYRITEISAPSGYKLLTEPIYVVIPKDKNLDDVKNAALTWLTNEDDKQKLQSAKVRSIVNAELIRISNTPEPGIEFYKVSVSDNSRALGGAEFELTKVDDDTWKRTATSNLRGAVSFPNVPAGEYKLVETQAPNGYLPSGGYWTVKIQDVNGVRTVTYDAHDGAPAIQQGSDGQSLLTNREIPTLPSVGGSGTLVYSLFGLALMAMASAAAYALARKRRRIER